MGLIQSVSWDCYGTLLDTSYGGESYGVKEMEKFRARQGAKEALEEIESKRINQCTCSDGYAGNLINNLTEAEIDVNYFDILYPMERYQQKDFSQIIEYYRKFFPKMDFKNLLVIGDNYELDIVLAKKQKCQTLWLPETLDGIRVPLDVNKIYEILDIM